MPETQDWAAASVTAVQVLAVDISVPSTGVSTTPGIASGTKVINIVGLDVVPTFDAGNDPGLRGLVSVVITDPFNGNDLAVAAISPETPNASNRYPYGALFVTAGQSVTITAVPYSGLGSQTIRVILFYYYT